MNYLLLITLSALSLLAPLSAFAQKGYELLEPLPGLSPGLGVSLTGLLSVFFTLALSLSAAAAVVMITLGGVQYMWSDVPGTKSAGRERIRNAVYGLILVFGAWLIISTINPNLLLFNLKIGKVGSDACPYLVCGKSVDRTIRDATQANKDVQTATGQPGSFRPSMDLPNQRMGTDGQPSSEAGKAFVRDCFAIRGKPVAISEQAALGTYMLRCERP